MLLIWLLGINSSEIWIENSDIFIQENAFESVICEMVAFLSRPQCVNKTHFGISPTHGTNSQTKLKTSINSWKQELFII